MMVLELHQSAIPTPGQALRTGHGHDEIPIWRFNSSEISRPSAVFVLLVTSSHIAEDGTAPRQRPPPRSCLLGGWTRFSNCLVLQTANRVVNRDPVDPLCRLPRHINMHLIPIDHRHRTRRDIRYQTLSIASDISKPRQITRRTSRHLWALGRPPACRGGPRPLRSLVAVRRPGQGIFRHFSGLVSFGRAASVASPRELLSGQASGSSLRGRLPRDHSSLESRDTRACHRHEGTSFCPFFWRPRDGRWVSRKAQAVFPISHATPVRFLGLGPGSTKSYSSHPMMAISPQRLIRVVGQSGSLDTARSQAPQCWSYSGGNNWLDAR